MSTLLLCFTCVWLFLVCSVYSADCQSQKNENDCRGVSGCEWFNNACICATEVKIDFIFAVDVSGSIGLDGFKQEKEWLADVVQGGLTKDSRVGFALFSTDVNISKINLVNYTTSELVHYIAGIYYGGGWTNTAGVLQAILNEYEAEGIDNRQKVVIMTTDGNPCAPRSEGGCPYDVCNYAASIKAANIRIIVLGIGPDLTPNYLTCLLQDPDTDYIPVDSYNYDDFDKILPQLQQITCPVDYNLKITEVKAEPDNRGDLGSRFIEIWNAGSTVSGGDLIFDGLVTGTLPNILQIDQSQYLVLYDDGDIFKNITCVDCVCNPSFNQSLGHPIQPPYLYKCAHSVYYACNDNSLCQFKDDTEMTNTNWWQQINDTSTTNTITLIDEVKYDRINNNFPTILDGWTYELKQIAYDNDIGGNWQQSCFTFGTPGDPPITCSHSNCSVETCKQNGAENADYNPNTGQCICPSPYYPSGCTCLLIPDPSYCIAERVKNSSSTWFTRYQWERAEYEGSIEYELKYWNQAGTNTTVQSYATVKRVLEYDWDNRGINMVAGVLRSVMNVDNTDYYGLYTQCWPITQDPTPSPSAAPTDSPTKKPTLTPTMSPTHVLPWLFIGGDICESDRCDCSGSGQITDITCCMKEEDECTVYNRKYTSSQVSDGAADNGMGDKPQYITIQSFNPFGSTYPPPFNTKALYKFEYIGLTNLTNSTVENDDDDQRDQAMMITPLRGEINFDDSAPTSSERITFFIKSTPAKIVEDGGDAIFKLILLNCSSEYTLNPSSKCEIVYPFEYILYIEQIALGQGLTWWEREMEPILWWLIAALIAFILIIALLVYWCWNKTRIKGKALLDKGNELESLIEEDENGMAPDLSKDQIGYNPLALSKGPKTALIAGNADISTKQEIPKNERANVLIEKFQERQEYGPKYGAVAGGDDVVGYDAPILK